MKKKIKIPALWEKVKSSKKSQSLFDCLPKIGDY